MKSQPYSEPDYHDVLLASANNPKEWHESTLPQVVAAGRLFILNGKGEYERVVYAQYDREGQIRSIWQ